MASYDFNPRAGKARVFFRFAGRQFNKTVKVESDRAAGRLCALVEETIQDLQRGKLAMPPGADPVTFLLSGGKITGEPPAPEPARPPLTLEALFELYRADPPPHLEDSTRKMQEIHFRRILEVFPTKELRTFERGTAQTYVGRRAAQRYRGRPIQRETISKELKTLRQAWAWVASRDSSLPPPSFTLAELSFPKARARVPFLSWGQIEQEVARGHLKPAEVEGLWDGLWLDRAQVEEFLEHVRQAASPDFLYPMACFAAYTGARRSELCRSRVGDWQFETGLVRIRQKKRDKDKEITFRDVRLHQRLARVMSEWLGNHPGGVHAFCGRDQQPLTWDAATYHFKRALEGSEWAVVRGWHVLRHSFASNLAASGVDQRIIDRWMGHSTDVRLRYQHLRPQDEQDAIDVLSP